MHHPFLSGAWVDAMEAWPNMAPAILEEVADTAVPRPTGEQTAFLELRALTR
jgi:hypothetical protein